jgi:hypothetical protein
MHLQTDKTLYFMQIITVFYYAFSITSRLLMSPLHLNFLHQGIKSKQICLNHQSQIYLELAGFGQSHVQQLPAFCPIVKSYLFNEIISFEFWLRCMNSLLFITSFNFYISFIYTLFYWLLSNCFHIFCVNSLHINSFPILESFYVSSSPV